jgi:hypothetical protein
MIEDNERSRLLFQQYLNMLMSPEHQRLMSDKDINELKAEHRLGMELGCYMNFPRGIKAKSIPLKDKT